MPDPTLNISRRGFLTATAATTAGAVLVGCEDQPTKASAGSKRITPPLSESSVAFEGVHQAGVVTPSQAHLNLIAFTVRAGVDAKGIRRLLRLWTADARELTQGRTPLGSLEPELAVVPANLTITCGFGARLFDIIGAANQRPDWLGPIKAFSKDKLDPKWGEADLVLQLCCDDPVMLAHATRHMIRAGMDYVATRWLQQGFVSAHGSSDPGATPRNLFGQVDGTINPRTEQEQDEQVWIDSGADYLLGGSCMVARRIEMNIDTWEILDRESRETAIGRKLSNGAPLTGKEEFDAADFEKADEFGLPVIDPMSHMARSRPPADHPEQRIKRRAYNYDLPPEPGSERTSNTGLVFVCFQKNPKLQFEAIQQRLDEGDRLNQWITHIGSAVFFIPPGISGDTDYWGSKLLESVITE